MFQSKPAICCKRNRHRTLRSESLEKRELLSVSPMACLGELVPPENDQVACEENKLIEAKVDFSLDYKTPTGEIHIPETIDGFPFGRNPGDFDQMPVLPKKIVRGGSTGLMCGHKRDAALGK